MRYLALAAASERQDAARVAGKLGFIFFLTSAFNGARIRWRKIFFGRSCEVAVVSPFWVNEFWSLAPAAANLFFSGDRRLKKRRKIQPAVADINLTQPCHSSSVV